MKNNQVIVVESLNGFGEWVVYGLFKDTTEKKAINYYLKENGLKKGNIKQKMDGFYSEYGEARAYYLTVQTI